MDTNMPYATLTLKLHFLMFHTEFLLPLTLSIFFHIEQYIQDFLSCSEIINHHSIIAGCQISSWSTLSHFGQSLNYDLSANLILKNLGSTLLTNSPNMIQNVL